MIGPFGLVLLTDNDTGFRCLETGQGGCWYGAGFPLCGFISDGGEPDTPMTSALVRTRPGLYGYVGAPS